MSSRIYKIFLLVIKIELPVIRQGDRKVGRSVYKEQSGGCKRFWIGILGQNHGSKCTYHIQGTFYN